MPVEAASAALVWNNRILMVRRAREPARGQLAFPGGRLHAGETAEDAARREVLEETGLRAGELTHLVTLEPDGGALAGFRLHVFSGVHPGGEPVAGDDADHAAWYTFDELLLLSVTQSSLELARRLLAR